MAEGVSAKKPGRMSRERGYLCRCLAQDHGVRIPDPSQSQVGWYAFRISQNEALEDWLLKHFPSAEVELSRSPPRHLALH